MENPRIKVEDILNPQDLVKVTLDDTVDDARKLIENSGKKRIVVVDHNNQPSKMLKISDIAGHKQDQKISEISDNLEDVVIAAPDDKLDYIQIGLTEDRLAVVLDQNKKYMGVVTATDVARKWRQFRKELQK